MSKVTISSIFAFMYDAYCLKSLSKKLKNKNIDDLSSFDKLLVKFEKVATDFAQNPMMQAMVSKNDKSEHHLLLLNLAQYMSAFNQAKFEKAFEVSNNAFNRTRNEDLKQMYLITGLDALNMIKSKIVSTTDREIYQSKYEAHEFNYANLIEENAKKKLLADVTLENPDKKAVKIDIEYNGAYMSLAYLHYLNHDMKKAYQCMDNLINQYGTEKVRKHESGKETSGWFYRHHGKDYQYLVSSACDKYEALKNKQHNLEQNMILSELQSFSESPKLLSHNRELVLEIKERLTQLMMTENENPLIQVEIKDTCSKVLPDLIKMFTQTQNKEAINSSGKNAHDFLFEALTAVSSYLNNISAENENTQLVDMEAYSSFVQKKFKQNM